MKEEINEHASATRNPWKTLRTVTVYDNPWIKVDESQVIHPGGGQGIYGVVHFKNRAIGVVPIDEHGFTWLVGQFRYALGTYEWEIPEGGCPPGESASAAALRELEEETGLVAAKLEILFDNLSLSNSVSDERATIFVATNLSLGKPSPEPSEELRTRRLPLDEAIGMVRSGEITDSVSVIALLELGHRRGNP